MTGPTGAGLLQAIAPYLTEALTALLVLITGMVASSLRRWLGQKREVEFATAEKIWRDAIRESMQRSMSSTHPRSGPEGGITSEDRA